MVVEIKLTREEYNQLIEHVILYGEDNLKEKIMEVCGDKITKASEQMLLEDAKRMLKIIAP